MNAGGSRKRLMAVTVLGPSIARLAAAVGAVDPPAQPVKRYRVPVPPATSSGTENVATSESLYHPPPVGAPRGELTVRRNCRWKSASNAAGATGATVWFRGWPALPARDADRSPPLAPAFGGRPG